MVTGGLFNIGITAQIFLVASGFDLATRDSYFTIQSEVFSNHILAEHMYFTSHREWTDHKNMFLKPAIKCQINWQSHISSNILMADF